MNPPNSIPWPPIFYGLAIIGGFVMQSYWPLPWLASPLADFLFMAGLLMIVAALFIDLRSYLVLKKHKTTIMPTRAADHLVTSGPFSFSRNPIYLANTVLTFGLGLCFANPWLFVTGLGAAIATHHFAIRREEKHLDLKFGSAWRQYRKRVRRWI